MLILNHRILKCIALNLLAFFLILPAHAATAIPFNITMSEAVNVTGSPRIAVDVGGVTRYASYASGTGTSSLTFTYAAQAGDVDLDGVTLSSPIDLNGGTITDLNGNPETDLTFTVPDTSGIKIDYPSLSMDFIADADGRYTLNGTAYNDLPAFLSATGGTFARNSVGTYFDSAGVLQTASANQPRFDHDPVTLAPKGILIEESRTNLLKKSSEFDNSATWNQANFTITTNTTDTLSPDGAYNCEKLTTTANGLTIMTQSFSSTGTSVTYSIFAKMGSGATDLSTFLIRNTTTATNQLMITANLSTGTFSYGIGSSGASVSSVGNGWYRISLTQTTGITVGDTITIYVGATGGSRPAGQYVYVWGAQAEQGTFPTSYIPTTTAAVTRLSDGFTIPTTGGWFNASTGTFFSDFQEASATNTGGTTRIMGTGLNGRFLLRVNGQNTYQIFNGTSSLAGPAITINAPMRVSTRYGTVGLGLSQNGAAASTAAYVGVWQDQGFAWIAANYTGHIKKWKYYPLAASNTQLQLLTQ